MRLLIVVLACAAGLSAQLAEPDAAARLKQLEEDLKHPLKFRPGAFSPKTSPRLVPGPLDVCAIPLLKVGPDPAFQSNMPIIAPDTRVTFFIRQVTPTALSCDVQKKK